MKTLFLTTAIVLLSTTSAHAFTEQANECAQQASIVIQEELSLHSTADFYQGDFQSLAKTVATGSMYTGHGSSMMMSLRLFRY